MKYILACLWLLCYFPFINSYVEDQNQKVTVCLENLKSFESELEYQQWKRCLYFLEEHNISCIVKLQCQSWNMDDIYFKDLVRTLESKGNCVLHSDNCLCGKTMQLNYIESEPEDISQLPTVEDRELRLQIALNPNYFKNKFKKAIARKCDNLLLNGDPSLWTLDHFAYFKENIEYLLDKGVRFDKPL